MRFAVVFEGLRSPETAWSGIPWGMSQGLRELGHDVSMIRAAAPAWIERAHRAGRARAPIVAALDPEVARLRSWATARRFKAAGEFDAVLQLATGFRLPPHERLATYEDMTVVQAFRFDDAYSKLPRRARVSWVERQRECYAAAGVCLTFSSWAAKSIVEDYGVPADRVAAVGAGRNIDPEPAERQWSPPHFLFAGLDWERKNGGGVLRAFRELRTAVPEARLTVVGDHPEIDEPGVQALGRLSIREPEERRRFTRLFEEATCFVMPSFAEPYGIVYREAAAAGVPSIGTSRGGSSDAVGSCGVCVDPEDEEGLLAEMRRLSDPEVVRRIGALGVESRDETTWKAIAGLICEQLGSEAPAVPR
jgi:glycosyltransferase involved in cell wall biosynthesis